jgi:hypothetical protein
MPRKHEIIQKMKITAKERKNADSYLIDAGFSMGNGDFEAEVIRLRQHPDKVRDVLRLNFQLKLELEELSKKYNDLLDKRFSKESGVSNVKK